MLDRKTGFTIIELVVAICVIGILASVSVIGYGQWHKTTIIDKAKNDLSGAMKAMDNYRNFKDTYPVDVTTLADFSASKGITITGGSSNGSAFCINASSTEDTSIKYYIDSTSGPLNPIPGTCS